MRYGITNELPVASLDEVERLLIKARQLGFLEIDTAVTYGESETILGKLGVSGFSVTTKLPAPEEIDLKVESYKNWILRLLGESRARLDALPIENLLVHDGSQLTNEQFSCFGKALTEVKEGDSNLSVGISVYNKSDLERAGEYMPVEVVQRPVSIISKDNFGLTEGYLRSLDVKVYSRSIFLQGILLLPWYNIPPKLAGLKPAVRQLHLECQNNGIGVYDLCVSHAAQKSVSDAVIIGCRNARDLDAFEGREIANLENFDLPNLRDENLLDPRNW